MANFKRKKPRSRTRSNLNYMSSWPKWWDLVFHTRPKRRREQVMLDKVKRDFVDPDDLAWPLGNHKPHNYFW